MSGILSFSDATTYQLAKEGRSVPVYNERAFRYLLDVERMRAKRSGIPLCLLLVTRPGHERIDQALAQHLFSRLWLATRETDVLGWFREGSVAGVALAQDSEMCSPQGTRQVRERVSAILRQETPAGPQDRFKVRVFRFVPMQPRADADAQRQLTAS